MKFSDVKPGHQFRLRPEGQRFGDLVFTRLPKTECSIAESDSDRCHGCWSPYIYNAHNGCTRIHVCAKVEVFPV